MLRKAILRDGKLHYVTEQMEFVTKVDRYGMRHQNHFPTKEECPNCKARMKVYEVLGIDVVYICHGCWKKFKRQEFNSDGSRIKR